MFARLRCRRFSVVRLAVAVGVLVPAGSAVAGPVWLEPAGWNQGVSATPGGWWTSPDGGVTIYGKPNADFPSLAYLQTAYCNPYGPATQLVGAGLTRIRWHANANDMKAYLRFLAPNGNDLGVGGGLTSLASTRRYFYNYVPEGVNLELQKDALTADAYSFAGGQCVWGSVIFNGLGSDGVLDSAGFTPLVTNRLDSVRVEDLQGPAVSGAASWTSWITGNDAPIEWDQSDNTYRRGTTGARVTGGGAVDLGDTADGHLGAWVPVGGLPDGAHQVCGYRAAPGWGEAQGCATFKLDRTDPAPPQITLSPDLAGAWANTAVGVSTQATGDGSGSGWDRNQFSVDGGGWVDSPAAFTITAEGDHTVASRAVDRAGRVSAPSGTRVVRIDRTPPVVSGVVVDGGSGVLSWAMSDRVGFGACPARVELSGPATNGAVVEVFNQPAGSLNAVGASVVLPLGTMANGDYTARLVVCDTAGNATSVPVAFTWTGNPDGGLAGAAARFVAMDVTSPGSTTRHDVAGVAVPVVRRVYNQVFSVSGRLQRPDGSVFAHAPVELRDAAGVYGGGGRTTVNGVFTVSARASIGGAWTLGTVGSSVRVAVAWLEVRPRVATRVRMTSGRRVLVVSGSLAPSTGVGGKVVQLEWFDRTTRRWRPALDGRVGVDGRFRLRYRFSRPGRYRVPVRVSVTTDAGWPYLATTSRPVTVTVG